MRTADTYSSPAANAELMRKAGIASGSRSGSDGHDEGATPLRLGEWVLSGIVIDAQDVARMHRFWSRAMRGRTDGLRLPFTPTAPPKARRPTPLPTTPGA